MYTHICRVYMKIDVYAHTHAYMCTYNMGEARGLCPRLMRVNTYNDVIHWTSVYVYVCIYIYIYAYVYMCMCVYGAIV